jgi:LytS/YehU family sensor histidine kinase
MDNPEKAGEAVLTLSDLLRYNLESSKIKYVALNKEIEFIDNYIQLESLRLGENCKINFSKDGDFNTKAIAPLILIPFVENCFKHGIGTDKSKNFIQISITLIDNTLSFTTENRIALSRMNHHYESIKIGIENVKRRLEMIYPNKHTLNLSSDNYIYKVLLQIEL